LERIQLRTFRLFFGILTVSLVQSVYGQKVEFNHLSLKEGLSQGTARCMAQDSSGFMWIGTNDGLNRYDGYVFEVLKSKLNDSSSISNNAITALAVGSEGYIWAGTTFGLNRIDPKTLNSKSYFHWFEDTTSLSSNRIKALAEDRLGRLWIGTDNGLNRLDDAKTRKFIKFSSSQFGEAGLTSHVVTDLLIDSKNRVWVATDGGLNLYIPETNSFRQFRNKFHDANSLSNNTVTSIAEDLEGNILIGTKHGLNKYNPEMDVFTQYFTDFPRKGLLASSIINDLLIGPEGDIWVASPSGLNRLSNKMNKSTHYHTQIGKFESLPNDFVLSLFLGQSGLIWIGTKSAGVATLDLEAPQFHSVFYYSQDGYAPEENSAYAFLEIDTATIWVGTGKGIASYNPYTDSTAFLTHSKTHGLKDLIAPIFCFATTPDNIIWIGTQGNGLAAYFKETDSLVYYTQNPNDSLGIPSNTINDIKIDDKHNLWIATGGGGLSYFDRELNTFKTYRFEGDDPQRIRENNINSIALDKSDNVWFGTGNSGLYRLKLTNGKIRNYAVGDVNTGKLPSNAVNQVYLDFAGKLWVATSGGGISRYDYSTDKFKTYNSKNGLTNDVVLALASSRHDSTLWLSTNGSISTFNYSTETFRNYTEQAVIGQNTFYPRSSSSTSKGLIIFGGANGFDFINAIHLQENLFVPPILITGFHLIDQHETKRLLQGFLGDKEKMVLEYNHSGFTIDFAALNFKQSYKNQYAYRLKGLFDQWRYIGTRHFATFSNLNPGTYTFEVKGSNNDGLFAYQPATLKIDVRPAYWQTLWFQILIIIAILAFLFLFYRYKLTSSRERNQLLEQAVTERTTEIARERDTNAVLLREIHHRVKNNLQIIVSLLNLQSRFITDSKLLDVFSEIQNRVRSMSLIHEKMYKTENLKTVNIAEYVTDLSQSLLDTYQLGQKVNLDVEVDENRFNSDTLTPLGLIINEVISNALKYAFHEDKTGRIFVRLTKLDSFRFRLVIGDDGIGIPSGMSVGNKETFGTELITAVSEQLNGSIKLLHEVGGTVYQVDFEDVKESN